MGQLRNDGSRVLRPLRGRVLLVRRAQVDEMMACTLLFVKCGFGGADVEPAINEHRIGRDDFAIEQIAQLDCHLRFAAGCRADQQQQLRCGIFRFWNGRHRYTIYQ